MKDNEKNINIKVNKELWHRAARYAAAAETSKKETVAIALDKFLKSNGY